MAGQWRRRRAVQRDADAEAIGAIAAAHRRAGNTAILPTVITDAPAVLAAALAAAREAAASAPGAFGVHVEGPFIDPRRKGVHLAEFIRADARADCEQLIAAKAGAMVVTLAPAAVGPTLIARLAAAGIVVSLGHAEASGGGGARRLRRRRARGRPISSTQ